MFYFGYENTTEHTCCAAVLLTFILFLDQDSLIQPYLNLLTTKYFGAVVTYIVSHVQDNDDG